MNKNKITHNNYQSGVGSFVYTFITFETQIMGNSVHYCEININYLLEAEFVTCDTFSQAL